MSDSENKDLEWLESFSQVLFDHFISSGKQRLALAWGFARKIQPNQTKSNLEPIEDYIYLFFPPAVNGQLKLVKDRSMIVSCFIRALILVSQAGSDNTIWIGNTLFDLKNDNDLELLNRAYPNAVPDGYKYDEPPMVSIGLVEGVVDDGSKYVDNHQPIQMVVVSSNGGHVFHHVDPELLLVELYDRARQNQDVEKELSFGMSRKIIDLCGFNFQSINDVDLGRVVSSVDDLTPSYVILDDETPSLFDNLYGEGAFDQCVELALVKQQGVELDPSYNFNSLISLG